MDLDDVDGIHLLLSRMRERDSQLRVFGSSMHRYQLGAPLSDSELQAFEAEHSITLPADYRFFLTHIGNGAPIRSNTPVLAVNSGAGPHYGVLPLDEAALECVPKRVCPLVPFISGTPYPGTEQWGQEVSYPGLLQISYGGCACYDFLVVNGPSYGSVWGADIDIRNFRSISPSFGAWYGRWTRCLQESALPRLANESAVQAVHVGMRLADLIALAGGEWELKAWSGRKMHLVFKHLSTQFEIENDMVVRVISHKIGC